MNIPEAIKITGGLTNTSKMPCYSYGLPAYTCHVGSRLRRESKNSVCAKCYAHKSRYSMMVVKDAYHRRYNCVLNALKEEQCVYPIDTEQSYEKWVEAMAYLINAYGTEYFRWHDSGDILSLKHLEMIIEVVNATPDIMHWLPTLEFGICNDYVNKHGKFSEIPNLIVRLSTPIIDAPPHTVLANTLGCQTSLVTRKREEQFKAYKLLEKETKKFTGGLIDGIELLEKKQELRETEMAEDVCTAKMQDNSCMDCRKCWDKTQTNITYVLH